MNKADKEGAITDEFARLQLEYLANGRSFNQWEQDRREILSSVKKEIEEKPEFLNSLHERHQQMQKDGMTYRDAFEMWYGLMFFPKNIPEDDMATKINMDIVNGNLDSLKEECKKQNILPPSKYREFEIHEFEIHVKEVQCESVRIHKVLGPVPEVKVLEANNVDQGSTLPEVKVLESNNVDQGSILFNPRNNPFYNGGR